MIDNKGLFRPAACFFPIDVTLMSFTHTPDLPDFLMLDYAQIAICYPVRTLRDVFHCGATSIGIV